MMGECEKKERKGSGSEEDVGPWRGEMQDSEKGADSVDGRCT